jgi:gliding motility-associated-like protein
MRFTCIGLLLSILQLTVVLTAHAQDCTGNLGAPVVSETFGQGSSTIGPALSTTQTNLRYMADVCVGQDGTYTLLSALGGNCFNGTWQAIPRDHTRDGNGYMMMINASIAPSVFFTYRISGNNLCGGTTYQFSAYIMNIIRRLSSTQGYIEPDVIFSIEKPDGTVIKTFDTQPIAVSDIPEYWVQQSTFFTAPADGSDVVVKMINKAPGGGGNDLALDDITVSPCGQIIPTGFGTINSSAIESNCAGEHISYPLVCDDSRYSHPSYQWQQNLNNGQGWVNIAGATQKTYTVDIPDAAAGTYQYRVGLLNDYQAGSEYCRIYADPLTITVNALPVAVVAATTNVCMGQPFRLSASGGERYQWTGPNGFTSTENNPLVAASAAAGMAGDYTVTVFSNSCASVPRTTKVTILPAAVINSITANSSICEGDPVQLNVAAANATHYRWSPAAGLSQTNIANPVANPAATTTYTVEVSNEGCTEVFASRQVTITVNQKPVADAGTDIKIIAGQSAQLRGAVKGDRVTYYWTPATYLDDPSLLNPVTRAPASITYTFHVVSQADCGESTSTVEVTVLPKLIVPNTISPNGDGINDLWTIDALESYTGAEVTIYNRQGQQLYHSFGYPKPWNGTYNGKPLPVGTYYYIIDLKEQLPKISGWLFVVR